MSESHYIDIPALQSVDSRPIRGATPDLLDFEQVSAHIAAAHQRGRYRGSNDPYEYLVQRKCLAQIDGTLAPTLAGILCFGSNPQALFPRAVVDIGHYRGGEPLSYEVVHLEKDIGGSIVDQLARVETYLWNNTHHGMTLAKNSLQRIELHEYPQAVIRELIVNMLVHRDYMDFRAASRVFLFRNRIDWISPGGLPDGVTVDNILSSQAARNPVILSILYEAGYVEAIGQGLATVVAALQRAEMVQPRFVDNGANFTVTVYGLSLDIIAGVGLFADLNPAQRKILALIRTTGDVSIHAVREILPDRAERTIQRDLRGLVDAGFVTTHGGARALRYRLSDLVQ